MSYRLCDPEQVASFGKNLKDPRLRCTEFTLAQPRTVSIELNINQRIERQRSWEFINHSRNRPARTALAEYESKVHRLRYRTGFRP